MWDNDSVQARSTKVRGARGTSSRELEFGALLESNRVVVEEVGVEQRLHEARHPHQHLRAAEFISGRELEEIVRIWEGALGGAGLSSPASNAAP